MKNRKLIWWSVSKYCPSKLLLNEVVVKFCVIIIGTIFLKLKMSKLGKGRMQLSFKQVKAWKLMNWYFCYSHLFGTKITLRLVFWSLVKYCMYHNWSAWCKKVLKIPHAALYCYQINYLRTFLYTQPFIYSLTYNMIMKH